MTTLIHNGGDGLAALPTGVCLGVTNNGWCEGGRPWQPTSDNHQSGLLP